ncbi:hypothetical protein FACS1894171_2590 [Clostridia bacterium]|nr:hypothetical protein FACS1894171_2590 [Clostridia bacterium]
MAAKNWIADRKNHSLVVILLIFKHALEPVFEARFRERSYGFRLMRDTRQALERATDLVHTIVYHWIVEGDISKRFDKIEHRIPRQIFYPATITPP